MSPDQIATVIIVVLQSGALAFAFKKITDGLSTKIALLEGAVKTQEKTMGSLSKGLALMDDVNDRYIGRLKKLEEHFDVCIRDLELIKDRQLKARDEESEWLRSENIALKNELHNQLPAPKKPLAALFSPKSDPNPADAPKTP